MSVARCRHPTAAFDCAQNYTHFAVDRILGARASERLDNGVGRPLCARLVWLSILAIIHLAVWNGLSASANGVTSSLLVGISTGTRSRHWPCCVKRLHISGGRSNYLCGLRLNTLKRFALTSSSPLRPQTQQNKRANVRECVLMCSRAFAEPAADERRTGRSAQASGNRMAVPDTDFSCSTSDRANRCKCV